MSSSGAHNCGLISGTQALNQVPGPDKGAQEESRWDKYNKCGFMNVQHIDIHGRFQTCYSETNRRKFNPPLAISVYSRVPSDVMNTVVSESRASMEKLSRMTTVTKNCSLYPGHDILSKRLRGRNAKNNPRNFTCALVAR